MHGRADKAVAGLLGVARFQPVRADAKPQQRVAVKAVRRLVGIKEVLFFSKQRVILREIGDDAARQQGQIAHRHQVACLRPAVRVGEGRVCHAHFLRALCHQAGKACLGAIGAERLGDDCTGVVARQHDDAAQQAFDRHPFARFQKQGGPGIIHCVLRHGQFFVQGQTAVTQGLEGHVQRHQLGHRRRRQRLVRVLGQQDRAGGVVDHKGRAGAGVKGQRGQGGEDQRKGGSKGADHHWGVLQLVTA